ncbi:MAG: hypothetical protein ABIP80_01425, partial [Ferruginibacter sp.]
MFLQIVFMFKMSVILLFLIPPELMAQVVVKGRKPARTQQVYMAPIYSLSQLTGKWQEIKRTPLNTSVSIPYADSLQLNFYKRDSVIVRDGVSMSQKGNTSISGKALQVAGDTYTIVSLSKNTLIINDGEYYRLLNRRKTFYHETLGKIIVQKENISDPVVIEKSNLEGKWHVYRTQAMPGAAEDSAIIKQINFKDTGSKSVSGEIVFTKAGITQTQPFTGILDKTSLVISSTGLLWNLL